MKTKNNHIAPPRLAEKLLLWFLKDELAEEVLGDLDEKYQTTIQKHNSLKANVNYWFQVLNYLRPFAIKSKKVNKLIIAPMKTHFKYTTRIFRRNSLITLASLASIVLGVLSSFLIYLWVEAEVTTDQFHSNYDQLYIPGVQQSTMDSFDPLNTSLFFKTKYSEYSEIDKSLQAIYINPDRIKFEYENTIFKGAGLITDSIFFEVFDFKLLSGDTKEVLKDPSNVILTAAFAKKVFGDSNPLGETIEIDQLSQYKVAGILEDVPSNSSFTFDFILPSHSRDFWGISGIEFLVANNSFNLTAFNEKIKDIGKTHQQFKESTTSVVPFNQVYFDLDLDEDLFSNQGDMADVQTMVIVALVILLVSALNFTNMQSTLVLSQIKNKSIKHIHGARKLDFFFELVASRILYTLTSILMVASIFALIKTDYLSFLELTVNKSWLDFLLMISLACAGFIVITTFFSVLQSTTSPQKNMLFSNKTRKEKILGGNVLTTVQYVLAITLIVASCVIFKQFKYMQGKDLGFDPQNLVSVKFLDEVKYSGDFEQFKKDSEAQKKNYTLLKTELGKIAGIESFSQGELPLSRNISGMSWKLSNSDFEYTETNLMTADPDYAALMGLQLIKGRFFSDSLDTERQSKVVINQAAMEYWGIADLDNVKVASSSWDGEDDPWTVIGVVEDFNYEHLSRKVEPLIMVYFEDFEREFTLRIADARFQQTIDEVAGLFNTFYPNRSFSYTLLENQLQRQYEYEKRLSQTFLLFTIIALTLSSLGLFTFALYHTQKRTKEIGIRKVVGANTGQVITLLSSDFLKWVLLAFIIALPISYYAMNEWLTNFANRTSLSWWIFAIAGLIAFILAMITVIGQSYTVANKNPVQALRHE